MTVDHPTPYELAAYTDGEVEPERSRVIARHLQLCPQCQSELAGLASLSQELRQFGLPPVLEKDIWPAISQRLQPRRQDPQRSLRPVLGWLPPAGLAAAIFMLQAVLMVSVLVSMLGWAGVLDWQQMLSFWSLDRIVLPASVHSGAVSLVLSWLLGTPLGQAISILSWSGSDPSSPLVTWLMPGALALLWSFILSALYLTWLLGSYRTETIAAAERLCAE